MDEVKSELLKAFVQHVVPVLATGLATIAGWLLLTLRNKLAMDTKGGAISAAGAKALHFAHAVVNDLEATIKPELQEAVKDGILTKEEVAELRAIALARVKTMLGVAGIAELQKLLGLSPEAVDQYLLGMIETAVASAPRKSIARTPEEATDPGMSPSMAPA